MVRASTFAALHQITLALANFYLQKAEEKELLCRDESYEGLLYFPNIFKQPIFTPDGRQ